MKRLVTFLLLSLFTIISCKKNEDKQTEPVVMPVTEAVKTGDWMVIYYENSIMMDMGLTFLKFSTGGSLAVTKDGVAYNGTWTETNAGGNNTLAINITTTDTKLVRANRTWKVTNVSEFFIDLKDANTASNATALLMKH